VSSRRDLDAHRSLRIGGSAEIRAPGRDLCSLIPVAFIFVGAALIFLKLGHWCVASESQRKQVDCGEALARNQAADGASRRKQVADRLTCYNPTTSRVRFRFHVAVHVRQLSPMFSRLAPVSVQLWTALAKSVVNGMGEFDSKLTTRDRMALHAVTMKKSQLAPKESSTVPCPSCGVAAGMRCISYSGAVRTEPHVERKLAAIEAVEKSE